MLDTKNVSVAAEKAKTGDDKSFGLTCRGGAALLQPPDPLEQSPTILQKQGKKKKSLPGALPGLISASKAANGHAKAGEAALQGLCQSLPQLSTLSLTTSGQHCHGAAQAVEI